MGVYIKGISMPEFGEKIIILTSSGYVEDVSGQVIDGIEAIPVPDHGRVVDADALIAKITDAAKEQPEIADVYYEEASVIGGWLYSMPTIIPADKED